MKSRVLFLFYLLSSQLINADIIDVYHCFGNDRRLIVEGRVLDPREFDTTKKDDGFIKNIWRKLGHLINDERKNSEILMQIEEQIFHSKTDDEGYFAFDVNSSAKEIKLTLKDQNSITTKCKPFIPSAAKQVGIISDFDDTVVISDVTNKLKLIYQLLFKNYKQRTVIKGMREHFAKILKNSPDKPLFFITGSPNQLHHVVVDFLKYHNFPKFTLMTKKIHGNKSYNPFKQQNYKQEQIEELISLYPQISWVLFGDSGEKDEQIYHSIAKKYPDKIKAIYIRNVDSGVVNSVKYR